MNLVSVDLTGGDVILNGNRFVLTGGAIQFVNPSMTQPVVNVTMTTSIQQYNINLRFQGPTDQLNTQFTSDPSLPQADIIHLLAFGQTTEAAANSPAVSANQQAESLIASQVSSQVTGRIARAAGIPSFPSARCWATPQPREQAPTSPSSSASPATCSSPFPPTRPTPRAK